MESTPEISVVLVAGERRARGANALASLLAQDGIERAEIVLIDLALDQHPPLPGSEHASVRTIQMGYDLHIGELRTYGARVARAPLVGYLEEHALALPGWLKALLDAFARRDGDVIAGVVVPANPNPSVGTLVNTLSFGRWLEPASSGPIDLLPGHNTAYRRVILLSIGDKLDDMMLAEPTVQWCLRELGYTLHLESSARWTHLNEDRPGSIFLDYFYWNVLFGRLRTDGRPLLYRGLRILTVPLILPVRVVRSVARLRRNVGEQWYDYMHLFPYILLMHLADAWGLMFGYLGAGQNLGQKLTVYELSQEREPPPVDYARY